MSDDRDLRDAYARLRDEESRTIPAFRVLRRASSPVMRFATAFAVMLLVAIGTVVILRPKRMEPPSTASISTWRAPTDFLLQTPGRELVVSVPELQPQIPGGRS